MKTQRPQIGFIGLGIMGAPMARNLLAAGYPVHAFNRTRVKAEPLAGARLAHSPADAASQADVVITMVTDSPDVVEVVTGPAGVLAGARLGTTLVDMTTMSPEVTRQLAARLEAAGLEMLDVPVTLHKPPRAVYYPLRYRLSRHRQPTADDPMKTYTIAVIAGDATGPEVIAEALKVLRSSAATYGFKLDLHPYGFGGERYLETGEVLPDSALGELRGHDAILLGAIGHPDVAPGILEKGILLRLRFELEQYINLRPVKLYRERDCPLKDKGPADVDFVVVRENNEGIYLGMGGNAFKGTPHEVATQEMLNTRRGVERCVRYAFEFTRQRADRNTLLLCAKTNVLTFAHDLWWRAFNEVGDKDYPDIKREYAHVDATCMWMVKNPEWFDVIVTENMFGDIITDLGAMIQGGMGIAAGGNINPEGVSMFEPIGGSAPKYAGQNVINPLAAIMAGQMLLHQIGERQAASGLEDAVRYVLDHDIDSLAAGRMGHSTTEVGDLVAQAVAERRSPATV